MSKRVTSIDLQLEYRKSSGDTVLGKLESRFKSLDYCIFIEDKLLESLNKERELEELFNQTAIFENGQ